MNLALYRAVNTLLLIGAVAILALAAWLEPDSTGFGTHTQLGFAECVIMDRLSMPCPMCGMTTTFALMADLRPLQAIKNQPFGFILFLSTVGIAVVSAVEIAKPRSLWPKLSRLTHGLEVKVVGTFFISMMIAWAYKVVQIQIFLYPSP